MYERGRSEKRKLNLRAGTARFRGAVTVIKIKIRIQILIKMKITVEVRLPVDYSGTVGAVRAPRMKTLVSGRERTHVWSRLPTSHEDITAVKVKATRTGRQTSQVGSRLHVLLTLAGLGSTAQAAPRPQRPTSFDGARAGGTALPSQRDRT